MYRRRSFKHKSKSQSSLVDATESTNQTAKSTVSKSSSKGDTEKQKREQMKSLESAMSQTDTVQTATAPPAEKPTLAYSRKPESISMKTQLINKLPASFVGDFSMIDHVCPRHSTIKTRETVNGNRLPLIVTVIQRTNLPPLSKYSSPIKQHPPPFHAMLDFNNDKSQVTDHVLKRDKPAISRSLVPSMGTKSYSFGTTVDKQKSPEVSSSTLDLQLSLSPKTRMTNRFHPESVITLVTSELFDNILPKPKKHKSDSMKLLPKVRRSDSLITATPEDASEETHPKVGKD
ncbi:unnamed protein product [Staurois parvus]|uniref:Uncharacterized protein n=1 Tax=Staurois parvus TaxID=386267 RepID=A0ABN9F6Y6_9NEOB|nr:unnamed protein product [Staurois parvus]